MYYDVARAFILDESAYDLGHAYWDCFVLLGCFFLFILVTFGMFVTAFDGPYS